MELGRLVGVIFRGIVMDGGRLAYLGGSPWSGVVLVESCGLRTWVNQSLYALTAK